MPQVLKPTFIKATCGPTKVGPCLISVATMSFSAACPENRHRYRTGGYPKRIEPAEN